MTDSATLTGLVMDTELKPSLGRLGEAEPRTPVALPGRSGAPGCRRNPSYLTLVRGS